jgi:hypothetical protein
VRLDSELAARWEQYKRDKKASAGRGGGGPSIHNSITINNSGTMNVAGGACCAPRVCLLPPPFCPASASLCPAEPLQKKTHGLASGLNRSCIASHDCAALRATGIGSQTSGDGSGNFSVGGDINSGSRADREGRASASLSRSASRQKKYS